MVLNRDNSPLFIGIDFGTSGCRAIAIDSAGVIVDSARQDLPLPKRNGTAVEQDPVIWWWGLKQLISSLLKQITPETIAAIAIDGTSGTVLLSDAAGRPLSPALMYNDTRAVEQARQIARCAVRESAAHGASSGLAKALWLLEADKHRAERVQSQADWLASRLTGRPGTCDANNALKLGYDAVNRCWPQWLGHLALPESLLPDVVQAGTPIGNINPEIAAELGLPKTTMIVAGTTDSTAAIIATGASQVGEAVTSLGSTLVVKVIAERAIFAPEYGVYSQPLGGFWLVGGASNSGGTVLQQFFSDEQMAAMTPQLDPNRATGLDYYPLPGTGERFPINDPRLAPRLEPRPDDDLLFFQGLLEGIARIEQQGYRLLERLGAPYPISVRSAGGGAVNIAWTAIRQRMLGVPVLLPKHSEAAYGAALLARKGVKGET